MNNESIATSNPKSLSSNLIIELNSGFAQSFHLATISPLKCDSPTRFLKKISNQIASSPKFLYSRSSKCLKTNFFNN